ncbi:uncharacterized protein M421DRAFT_418209 [Didymella exigua CBS 183.55]|uniref:Uncharacterized protein n=1 Tax=Didymella exigua CBS 183.55 TaxID=1150837 RepID=A0A6A5RU92_9PLEO|nr:uncharacterized protein M421DRAFT_418209 [Didymella exigua CBS 183.55]KAF1930724.1 hypothetical protein M421DRAFT_418209 [Didymella exigua CBS 183.55]
MIEVKRTLKTCADPEAFRTLFNRPVDSAKIIVDYNNGDSMSMPDVVVIGSTAAAVEVATNRVGATGRQLRTKCVVAGVF